MQTEQKEVATVTIKLAHMSLTSRYENFTVDENSKELNFGILNVKLKSSIYCYVT